MDYKQISFNIETAKDILAGRIKGRITTKSGYDVKIRSFNSYNKYYPISGVIIYEEESDDINSWTVNGNFYENNNPTSLNLVLWIEDKEKEEKHKFKPFDRILVPVRDSNLGITIYVCRFFSHYVKDNRIVTTTNGGSFSINEVLPFEGNEHLVGQPV